MLRATLPVPVGVIAKASGVPAEVVIGDLYDLEARGLVVSECLPGGVVLFEATSMRWGDDEST